jgi:hypothetical protein
MSEKCGTFSAHLRSKEVNPDGTFSDIFAAVKCKAWDCPECRKMKGSWLQEQIQSIFADSDLHMLTLTYFQNKSKIDVWKSLGSTWNKFRTYLKKLYPDLIYIRIIEPHKSGYPHLHVLISKFISIKKATKYITAQGFGWNCQLIKISADSGKAYVSKYLTKAEWSDEANKLRKLSNARIVSASKGIHLTPETTGEYNMIAPNVKDNSIEQYVRASVSNSISEGCFPCTIYIGYRFIRINWSCEMQPSQVPIAQEIINQALNNFDDYFN